MSNSQKLLRFWRFRDTNREHSNRESKSFYVQIATKKKGKHFVKHEHYAGESKKVISDFN